MAPTAVGDSLLAVTYANFDEQDQQQIVWRPFLADDKKTDYIGIHGAFTPNCSTKHEPGFVEKADELKSKGVGEILFSSVDGLALMHHMAHPGSRQNDLQLELTHPNPNSICVACGYQCLTLEDTVLHMECPMGVLRKPVPLCSPTDPSWTPTVASVETPPPPPMLSLTPAVASLENPPPPMLSLTHPVASVETPPPMMLSLTPTVASVETPPPMIPSWLPSTNLVHYTSNYQPLMFPPQHQALVMPTCPYPPYPVNHPGNTQNTGNGKKQGNGRKRVFKKIMKTLSSGIAISSMLATWIGNGFLLLGD